MSTQIQSHLIKPLSEQTIKMPRGAKILTVQVLNESIVFWAEVNPLAKMEKRKLRLINTGIDFINLSLTYIGSVYFRNAMRHIYEEA